MSVHASSTGIKPAKLRALAEQINEAHEHCVAALRAGVEFAREVGELLIQAKEQVPHGEWGGWLKANCPDIGERQYRRYMQIAAHWDEISEAAKRPPGTVLPRGIRGALALIAAPASANDAPATAPATEPDDDDRDRDDEEPDAPAKPAKPREMTAAALAEVQRDDTPVALAAVRDAAALLRQRVRAVVDAGGLIGGALAAELRARGVTLTVRETPDRDYQSGHYYTRADVTGIPALDALLAALDEAVSAAAAKGGR